MPGPGHRVAIGRGRTVRPGGDLTIVTWGATVEKSRVAAVALEDEGAEVGVIDLRSIRPWDQDLVAEAVAASGRLLVVHEDTLTAGFGGEVAAWVGEHCFAELDAPVRRVGAADTHVAYEPGLERAVLPQTDDIAAAARSLLAY
jgi:2-oxoisovalerate dehydrogenase E1 component